ncbi:MAG: hypothetical protein ACYC4R_13680 [Anaerolineae bacterium]
MFAFKPDYERTMQRFDAFWQRELIDRPIVQFGLQKPVEELVALPPSGHATPEDRWLDVDYQAELHLAMLTNQEFLGDTLPVAFPNLGPEVFSSFYGCPIHFGDYGTSWTNPILDDWSTADSLNLDWDSPYLRTLHAMTDAFLEIGEGKFITGMTDWHPGGDCLAAFRDPQRLALDMLTNLEDVQRLLARVEQDYFAVYDCFYRKLRAAGQPISTWLTLASEGKYYVPSNDFSIMISNRMFAETFLPGIVRECRFLDHSIYHLDGPGALRHLDSILSIPELDALQWVCGVGYEGFAQWVWVYRKAQQAGKGIQVVCEFSEIDQVMETLNPHGLYLSVSGVPSREAGLDMLDRLEKWCTGRIHPIS